MLVLSRQRDETIMIGDEIEITVVDIRGDKVRLGIAAPSRIAVHRKEVYESIRRENEQAARILGSDVETSIRPPEPMLAVAPEMSPGPGRLRVGTTPIGALRGATLPTRFAGTPQRSVRTDATPSKVPRNAPQPRAGPSLSRNIELKKAV